MAGVLRVIRHMREYRVHNNNNTSRLPARVPFVFFSSHLSEQLDAVDNGCRQRHGAARRRQRRPRQFLRHERLSVAMALAESQHHTSRGQKMARAGEEGHEEHDALTEVLQPLRRRAWREAARVGHGLCAAGPGCAAHWRARRWDLSPRSDSRRACAADGGSGGGGAAEFRCVVCRAGYRGPHDLFRPRPTAFFHLPSAEGRTVGGSADGAGVRTCGGCADGARADLRWRRSLRFSPRTECNSGGRGADR